MLAYGDTFIVLEPKHLIYLLIICFVLYCIGHAIVMGGGEPRS